MYSSTQILSSKRSNNVESSEIKQRVDSTVGEIERQKLTFEQRYEVFPPYIGEPRPTR
jgi:hypothetical protein